MTAFATIKNPSQPTSSLLSVSRQLAFAVVDVELSGPYPAGGEPLDLGQQAPLQGSLRRIALVLFGLASVNRAGWETAALSFAYDPTAKKLRVFRVAGPPGESPLVEVEAGFDLTGVRATGLAVVLWT